MALGDAAGSRSLNDKLLERDGENVDGLLLRAEFEERDGRRDRAIESVQRALNVDQTNPEIYVALAELNAKAGDKARARQSFEEGLQQMPQDFLLIQRYTQFLHQSGNKSRAVSVSRAFARALPVLHKGLDDHGAAVRMGCRRCLQMAEAAAGRAAAATRFRVDDPPGSSSGSRFAREVFECQDLHCGS